MSTTDEIFALSKELEDHLKANAHPVPNTAKVS